MTNRERQLVAIRCAARVTAAREALAAAEKELRDLCADFGSPQHYALTTVKLALRECEAADMVTRRLVNTFNKIENKK